MFFFRRLSEGPCTFFFKIPPLLHFLAHYNSPASIIQGHPRSTGWSFQLSGHISAGNSVNNAGGEWQRGIASVTFRETMKDALNWISKAGMYGRVPVQQVSLDALLHNLGLEVVVTNKEMNQGLFHPNTFCFSFTTVSSIKRIYSAALGLCAHVFVFVFFFC